MTTSEELKFLIDSVYNYEEIRDKIERLEQKIEHLELQKIRIAQIEAQIQQLPQQMHQLQSQLEQTVVDLKTSHHEAVREVIREVMPEHVSPMITRVPAPVSRFKEKVLKKLTKNSKEYIKGLILSMIHKYSKISGQQLREIIVDEQGLCSKSSFYRLLEELEQEENLNVLVDGKSKIYLEKTTAKHR